MNKPIGYDEAEAFTGEFKQLPPGGYICMIKKAMVELNKQGNEQLVLLLDVADGEYKDIFQTQYNNDTRNPKKYPNSGVYRQNTSGKSLPFFKGVITSIEKSNFNYKWNWDERTLTGKTVGAIFGREQYQKQDGTLAFATKPVRLCSVDTILAGVEPPKDKLLKPSIDRLSEEIQFDPNDIPF